MEASSRLQTFLAHPGGVGAVRIGPNSGQVLATGGDDGQVNLWRVGRPNCLLSLRAAKAPVTSIAFDDNERLLAGGSLSGSIRLLALHAGGKPLCRLTGHRAACTTVSFHPGGNMLASGSADATAKLWDIRSKSCVRTFMGHEDSLTCAEFSPDGRWVATGSDDKAVRLWDLQAGKLLHEFAAHRGGLCAIRFHPSEFWLATSSKDGTVKYFDLETFRLVGSTPTDRGSAIRAIGFLGQEGASEQEQRRLMHSLVAASDDGVKVWKWQPCRCMATEQVDWGVVSDMQISRDRSGDQRLTACALSKSESGMVSVWSVNLSDALKGRVRRRGEQSEAHADDSSDIDDSADSSDGGDGREVGKCRLSELDQRRERHRQDGARHEGPRRFTPAFRNGGADRPGSEGSDRSPCGGGRASNNHEDRDSDGGDQSSDEAKRDRGVQHATSSQQRDRRRSKSRSGDVDDRKRRVSDARTLVTDSEAEYAPDFEDGLESDESDGEQAAQSVASEVELLEEDADALESKGDGEVAAEPETEEKEQGNGARTNEVAQGSSADSGTRSSWQAEGAHERKFEDHAEESKPARFSAHSKPRPPSPDGGTEVRCGARRTRTSSRARSRCSGGGSGGGHNDADDEGAVRRETRPGSSARKDGRLVGCLASAAAPLDLSISEFLPRASGQLAIASKTVRAEMKTGLADAVLSGHARFLGVLAERQEELEHVAALWRSGDGPAAFEYVEGLGNDSVTYNLLKLARLRNGQSATLDVCAAALPALARLGGSPFEDHVKLAVATSKFLFDSFSELVRSTIELQRRERGSARGGVDVSREERAQKCGRCLAGFEELAAALAPLAAGDATGARTARDAANLRAKLGHFLEALGSGGAC